MLCCLVILVICLFGIIVVAWVVAGGYLVFIVCFCVGAAGGFLGFCWFVVWLVGLVGDCLLFGLWLLWLLCFGGLLCWFVLVMCGLGGLLPGWLFLLLVWVCLYFVLVVGWWLRCFDLVVAGVRGGGCCLFDFVGELGFAYYLVWWFLVGWLLVGLFGYWLCACQVVAM